MEKKQKQKTRFRLLEHGTRLRIMMLLFLLHLIPLYGLLQWLPFSNEPIAVVKFFPLDSERYFTEFTTHLSFQPRQGSNYGMELATTSKTNEPAYLRQDVALLYEDGELIGKLFNWKENTATLVQSLKEEAANPHRFDAITYHHAEFHENDQITSQQALSADTRYVIAAPEKKGALHSFNQAVTPEEQSWKVVFDRQLQKKLQKVLQQAIESFKLHSDEYEVIPLTALNSYLKQPLPGLTMKQSMEAIGRLWEGLYHYLVVGAKEEGTVSTIGSTIPLILIHRSGSHLLVIYQTKDGKLHQLRQEIPAS